MPLNLPKESDDMIVIVGSTADWTIYLFDENGACEDLSGLDAATFVVAPTEGAGPADLIVSFSMAANEITHHNGTNANTDPSSITIEVSQVKADALVAGGYLGLGNLRFGADQWKPMKPVRMDIRASGATKVNPP